MNESFSYLFLNSLKENLARTCELNPLHNRILVACSGGPDSVVLLHALKQLSESLRMELRVCHVNHGLRKMDSILDEKFVIDFVHHLDIPLTIRRMDEDEIDRMHNGNLEDCARQLRYQKLEQVAVELDCTHIATGHTRNDQAETVLHRILRSSGPSGLSGIFPIRKDEEIPIIRPLLVFDREQIIRYANENNLTFQQDIMNEDMQFTRVKIRKQLLPLLQNEYNPNIVEALARLAEIANDDETFWTSYVDNLLIRIGKATAHSPADRKRFLHLSRAEQCRLLRRYYLDRGIEPQWIQIHNAIALLESERPQSEFHLNASYRLYRRYDEFYFAPPRDLHDMTDEYPIHIPGITEIPDLGIKTITVVMPANVHQIKPLEVHTAEFDAGKMRHPVVIRTRREGDVIRPLGMEGTKKIKKIFQEHKVPLEQRDRVPLLCFDEDIAWITGYCISDTYRIDVTTTQVFLISIHPLSDESHS